MASEEVTDQLRETEALEALVAAYVSNKVIIIYTMVPRRIL